MLIFNRLRNRLRANLFYVKFRLYTHGNDPADFVVRSETNVCLEGYPRSANSFAVRMFRFANPNQVVAHHTHSPGNLAAAITDCIPTVALIRDPQDAIVSAMIAANTSNEEDKILQYLIFYEFVKQNQDHVVIADFDAVVSDFNIVIKAVNEKFGTGFSTISDWDAAITQVRTDLDNRYESFDPKTRLHLKPLPSNERSQLKRHLSGRVLRHPLFPQAQQLYQELTNRLKAPPEG